MVSDETRRKLAEGKIGTKNPMFGTVSPNRKYEVDEAEFRRLFVDEEWTVHRIARHFGMTYRSVQWWLKHWGIKLTHEQRAARHPRGEQVWNFVGKKTTVRGYIYRPARDHPAANRDGYVMEHRLVIEERIGRLLEPGEQIHHINLAKADNRPENLILFPYAAVHTAFHKYLELVAIALLGLREAPSPFRSEHPMFVAGQWVHVIDLMDQAGKIAA